MNPLMTIKGTLAVGFILALAIVFGMFNGLGGLSAVIWFHVLAGVVWIGPLYYFNFVQVPGVAQALAEADNGGPGSAAINKYAAPRALLWFRWCAVVTWLTGASGLAQIGGGMQGIIDAFTLSNGMGVIGTGVSLPVSIQSRRGFGRDQFWHRHRRDCRRPRNAHRINPTAGGFPAAWCAISENNASRHSTGRISPEMPRQQLFSHSGLLSIE